MQDKNKRMWDEVLGGIDEKFTAEAAEMLRAGEKEENARSEKGIEIRTERRQCVKKKHIWAWGASAAAVLVVGAVGAAVWMNIPCRNAIEAADSARSGDSSGVTLYKSEADNLPIAFSDIYNYNIDYGVFENYFIGEWSSSNTAEVCLYSYIGDVKNLGFYGGLHSVYEKDDGYYMITMSDGKSQVCFIPKNDTEHLYVYDDVGSVIEKVYYSDVYEHVSYGTDADREIAAGNYLSCAAIRRLDDDFGGVLTTVYSDVESARFNDNEGGQWSLIDYTDDRYEAPRLIALDDSSITLGFVFGNVNDESETRVLYAETVISESGSWYWEMTDDDGRTYYTGNSDVISERDIGIPDERFMGEWENIADPKENFVLSYMEDFFESGISSYLGCGTIDDTDMGGCVYMAVDTAGETKTSIIPFRSYGVMYVIYDSDPETMYCYADGSISGDPYAVYAKTGEVSRELPERGEVSPFGLYKFLSEYGDDVVRLFNGVKDRIDCEGISCVNGGSPYYILSQSDSAAAVMLDYTEEESGELISVAISFAKGSDGWHIADVEKAVEMTDGGIRTDSTDDGYYYLTEEQTDNGMLMHVYYYSENDGIMYELNAVGRSEYRLNDAGYLCGGSTLYVLGAADGQVCAAAYSNGKPAGVMHLLKIENEFSEPSLTLSDGYIRAEWTDGGYKSVVIDPNDLSDADKINTAP